MRRRAFLASLGATLASAAAKLPANKNVKWAVSLGLWNQFRPWPFTDILDVMRDTGFIGIRLTGFPGVLKTYNLTPSEMRKEVAKRKLHVATISFGGPAQDPNQLRQVVSDARRAMEFLATFGAKELVVFSPGRLPSGTPEADWMRAFDAMCECYNRLGEVAGEMGFRAGLHNHLGAMVEKAGEIDLCMAKTDPKLFHFAPDTAHMHLAGAPVVELFAKHKRRLVFMDYKDAKWTTPQADLTLDNGKVEPKDSESARFLSSIYDLGDGEVDFPACHRILKDVAYKGWICVDLDFARNGPRASYERCGSYVVEKLEPIYL
jgi:sugar phosphate isomerase/epimerase